VDSIQRLELPAGVGKWLTGKQCGKCKARRSAGITKKQSATADGHSIDGGPNRKWSFEECEPLASR